ncbi:Sec-independent protein translocase subunit TatA/TatB [Nitrospina gracilis]|uniref:Sec-independent protein translocase subunit TatA/TatB n=1 Tax=Nitrospina gracilis TaxID=35801 RepID=UPI001F025E91|nr:twin-arginine translocase TatA/TatE family subunit [Nitrospina gracilis]MCF8721894.1 Sec-independent protein translocase protein TatA [Nitrospina gracilis Nb-211]
MFDIGFFEIMILMGIGMFVIGPANLPRLAKAIGKGWGEFQRTFNELKQEVLDETETVKKTANMQELEQEVSAATKVDVDVNLDTDIRPNDN